MKTKSSQKRIGTILISLGLVALISAGTLYTYNLVEEHNAAKSSDYVAQILLEKIAENKETKNADFTEPSVNTDIPSGTDEEAVSENNAESDVDKYPSVEIKGEKYIGILSIPALQLKCPVNSEWSYQKLKLSPCRYSGNAEDNTLTIAAHNYRYHFGELTNLQVGEKVVFTDTEGEEYEYYAVEIETIEATSIDKVINNNFDLNLFTCNYNGDARILVKCNLINKKLF